MKARAGWSGLVSVFVVAVFWTVIAVILYFDTPDGAKILSVFVALCFIAVSEYLINNKRKIEYFICALPFLMYFSGEMQTNLEKSGSFLGVDLLVFLAVALVGLARKWNERLAE